MKLVLLKDHKGLGNKGETVEVSPGYAKNFLIPQKIAATLNSAEAKTAEEQKSEREKAKEKKKEKVKEIEEFDLTFKVKAKKDGTTYSGVTKNKLEKEIKKSYNLDVNVELSDTIKELGEFEVKARVFGEDVPVRIRVKKA